jgi:(p)ppGpp synthase/HD superfamily hydrolase
MNTRLEKQISYLNGYFQGKELFRAVIAMNLALEYHTGERKDGAKEVSHQFELVSYLIPIFELHEKDLFEDLVCIAFLHDLVEDYAYPLSYIHDSFGDLVQNGVASVTKKQGFHKLEADYEEYYAGIEKANIRGILVKMADRLHNLSSMIGAPSFTMKKREDYISEVMTFMIPTAKKVRKAYPKYYQVITFMIQLLKTYCKLIEEINKQTKLANLLAA